MKRIWKEIKGFEAYQVSNDGQVRREGRIISESLTPSGRPRVRLYQNGIGQWRTVSVLMRQAFNLKSEKVIPHDLDADLTKLEGLDLTDITSSPLFDMYPGKEAYEKLADVYKVSVKTIYYLKHYGKNWKGFYHDHYPE